MLLPCGPCPRLNLHTAGAPSADILFHANCRTQCRRNVHWPRSRRSRAPDDRGWTSQLSLDGRHHAAPPPFGNPHAEVPRCWSSCGSCSAAIFSYSRFSIPAASVARQHHQHQSGKVALDIPTPGLVKGAHRGRRPAMTGRKRRLPLITLDRDSDGGRSGSSSSSLSSPAAHRHCCDRHQQQHAPAATPGRCVTGAGKKPSRTGATGMNMAKGNRTREYEGTSTKSPRRSPDLHRPKTTGRSAWSPTGKTNISAADGDPTSVRFQGARASIPAMFSRTQPEGARKKINKGRQGAPADTLVRGGAPVPRTARHASQARPASSHPWQRTSSQSCFSLASRRSARFPSPSAHDRGPAEELPVDE